MKAFKIKKQMKCPYTPWNKMFKRYIYKPEQVTAEIEVQLGQKGENSNSYNVQSKQGHTRSSTSIRIRWKALRNQQYWYREYYFGNQGVFNL